MNNVIVVKYRTVGEAIGLLSSWPRTSYRQSHATTSKPLRLGSDEVCDFVFAGQLEPENRLLPPQTRCVRNALVLA
jgi:hypothetical protein